MIVPPLMSPLSAPAAALVRIMAVAAVDFAPNLPAGANFDGKVIRQLDSGNYLVDIGGKLITVEVQQALNPGFNFTGRLVTVGARPILELAQAKPVDDPAVRIQTVSDRVGVQGGLPDSYLRRMFEAQGVSVDSAELEILAVAARTPADARQMAGIGLLLRRAGVRVTRERVQGVLDVLAGMRATVFKPDPRALTFDVLSAAQGIGTQGEQAEFVSALGSAINGLVGPAPESGSRVQSPSERPDGPSSTDAENLQRTVWNLSYLDGTCHRAQTLRVQVGNQVMPIDLIMQGDDERADPQGPGRQRRTAMTVHTASHGAVQMEARLGAGQVQLVLRVESQETLRLFERHDAALRKAYSNGGFRVESLRYEIQETGAPDCVHEALSARVSAECGLDRRV